MLIGLRIMVAIIYQAYHQVRWVTLEAWAEQKTKLGQYQVQLGVYMLYDTLGSHGLHAPYCRMMGTSWMGLEFP